MAAPKRYKDLKSFFKSTPSRSEQTDESLPMIIDEEACTPRPDDGEVDEAGAGTSARPSAEPESSNISTTVTVPVSKTSVMPKPKDPKKRKTGVDANWQKEFPWLLITEDETGKTRPK